MVSWRFNDEWSFGAGVQVQYIYAKLTSKVGRPSTAAPLIAGEIGLGVFEEVLALTHSIPAATAAANAAITELTPIYANIYNEPFGLVQGDDWGVGFNLGVMYQPWESTTFGIGYRSAVAHELSGTSEFLDPIRNFLPIAAEFNPAIIPLIPAINQTLLPIPYKVDATAKVRTPDQINAGVTHYINDQWKVMGDVQWTHWTLLNELRVKFDKDVGIPDSVITTDWVNGWWYSIGTQYEYDCHWMLRGGFAYDRSPSRNDAERTPRVPDSDRYWLAVGATYNINYHFSIDFSYNHVFVTDTQIRNPGTNPGETTGTLNADYTSSYVDIIGLGGTYRF